MKIRLFAVIGTTVVIGAVAAGIVVATSGSSSNALYSFGGWGEGAPAPVGQEESITEIPLCVRGKSPVTLESITPVRVTGSVRFDRALVKRGPSKYPIEDGTPRGARPVAWFVIPPEPSCNLPHTGSARYDAIGVAHRTGPGGGEIRGFRVRYRAGGASGVLAIDATYQLCAMPSC